MSRYDYYTYNQPVESQSTLVCRAYEFLKSVGNNPETVWAYEMFKNGYYDYINKRSAPRGLSDLGTGLYELGQWYAFARLEWPHFVPRNAPRKGG